MPSEKEWLSVLSTINSSGNSIPNYYIFNGIRQLKNYGVLCEEETMVVYKKKVGWIPFTSWSGWNILFIHWKVKKGYHKKEDTYSLLMDINLI